MARTRMLKPDLRLSEKVASWPIPVRYFWVLLWGYLDDYGKGKDNPLLIKADCFPLDEEVTPDIIDSWLWGLAEAGVVVRYAVDGGRYIAAVNWTEHQKPQHPTDSKCPDWNADSVLRRDSRTVLEPLTPSLVKYGFSLEGGNEPPLFCVQHPAGGGGRCGACGDARRLHDAWKRLQDNKPTPTPGRFSDCKHQKSSLDHKGDSYCDSCGVRVS